MLRVNPPTAYLMLHRYVAPQAGHWVIQNAANSGVGHCLVTLARAAGMKSVSVVRRQEMVAPLRAHGANVVLIDGPDLDARVHEATGGGSLAVAVEQVYPLAQLKDAVAHAARGGRSGKILVSCIQRR